MKHCVISAPLQPTSSIIATDFSNGEGHCSLLVTKSKSDRESYPQFSLKTEIREEAEKRCKIKYSHHNCIEAAL